MSQVISSRTPEGETGQCPLCGNIFRIEPSQPAGDAPCPCCGSLLWFSRAANGLSVFDYREVAPVKERLVAKIAEALGVDQRRVLDSTSPLGSTGADSLDIVELVLVIEEEFDAFIAPDQDVETMTLADAIDFAWQAVLDKRNNK